MTMTWDEYLSNLSDQEVSIENRWNVDTIHSRGSERERTLDVDRPWQSRSKVEGQNYTRYNRNGIEREVVQYASLYAAVN